MTPLREVRRSVLATRRAIEAYRFVANVWRRADPELRPYVDEAAPA